VIQYQAPPGRRTFLSPLSGSRLTAYSAPRIRHDPPGHLTCPRRNPNPRPKRRCDKHDTPKALRS